MGKGRNGGRGGRRGGRGRGQKWRDSNQRCDQENSESPEEVANCSKSEGEFRGIFISIFYIIMTN